MSSPGFTGGMGPSDLYGGRATNFSGRSITLPSNLSNNMSNNTINNNNHFSTSTSTSTTPSNTSQNFHNPFYRTQQQLPSMYIDPCSQIQQNRSSNLIRRYLDPSSQINYRQNSTINGKRTLAEYQTQTQNINSNNLGYNSANAYLSNLVLRSVKPRNFLYSSPISPLSPMDFSNSPSESSSSAIPTLLRSNPTAQNSIPVNNSNSILQDTNFQYQNSNFAEIPTTLPDPQKKMMDDCLMELEKKLLEDNDDEVEPDANTAFTDSEWSETIQNLINFEQNPILIPESSPSSSNNSSSCSIVTPAAFSSKLSLMEAANAISEGKFDAAWEILNRLAQTVIPMNSDGRLTYRMVSALQSRMNQFEIPTSVLDLFGKEHAESTQLLFDNSLCFKAAFMAANIAILDAAFDETTTENCMKNLCVVDFDIGYGKRYIDLVHDLHARLKSSGSSLKLKITAVVDNTNYERERLITVCEDLSLQAERLAMAFEFKVVTLKITELTRESLGLNPEDILAVNFAFKLFRMPDESVSTDNPRDALLRRVKSLSPRVVTLIEQEMNANTAPFVARVAESFSYYNAMFDSIESTLGKESLERVKIEEGLNRKLLNTVACEGWDRVERCEVFGKWRARMSMAGFRLDPVSQKLAESVKARLAPGSLVIVKGENGGVCFGWMGRTLTVASAWR